MSISNRIISNAIVGLAASAGIVYGGMLGWNAFNYHSESIRDNYRIIVRIDGPFSRTEFTRIIGTEATGTTDIATKYTYNHTRSIYDGTFYDGTFGTYDGKVDFILETQIFDGRTFSRDYRRNEHYELFKKNFDLADEVLKETKERFDWFLK